MTRRSLALPVVAGYMEASVDGWWRVLSKIVAGFGCLGVVLLAIIGGPALLFGLLLWSASERTIYSRQVSPDERHEARVQFDDCGAPCGWAKVVFIKSRWMPFDSPLASCRAFLGDGTDDVRLEWQDEHTLLVRHGFLPEQVVDVTTACGAIVIRTRFDASLVSREP
jgi:hypothetical protein